MLGFEYRIKVTIGALLAPIGTHTYKRTLYASLWKRSESKVGLGLAKGTTPDQDSYIPATPATPAYVASCTKGRGPGSKPLYAINLRITLTCINAALLHIMFRLLNDEWVSSTSWLRQTSLYLYSQFPSNLALSITSQVFHL